jgi:hypothetical protein
LLAVAPVFFNQLNGLYTPESYRIQNPKESTPALRLGGCQKLKITNVIVWIYLHRCSPNTLPTAPSAAQSAADLRTTKAFGFGGECIDFSAQGEWQRVFPTRQWPRLFASVNFALQRFTARLELTGNAPLPKAAPTNFNRAKRAPVIGAAPIIERRDAGLFLANRQVVKASDAFVVR